MGNNSNLFATLGVAASGLHAQSARIRVVSENIANADSAGATPAEAPYRRKTISFTSVMDETTGRQTVEVDRIGEDLSAFRLEHDPGHPAADQNGYVRKPNVNTLIEMVDLREASRSYEANLKSLEVSRDMLNRALEILR